LHYAWKKIASPNLPQLSCSEDLFCHDPTNLYEPDIVMKHPLQVASLRFAVFPYSGYSKMFNLLIINTINGIIDWKKQGSIKYSSQIIQTNKIQ
jgi:hypothetical protein